MARSVDRGDPGSPDPDVTAQLLAFVEKTSDLVGVVDEQSRVLYLNEAARKRLGVGDTTDLTTVDMFPPHAFARYYDEIRPALLRSGTWHGELPVITGSGEAVAMAMTVVARVGPGGEVNGLVTCGREVEPPSSVRRADAAMYRAKATGRREVVAFEAGTEASITTVADELAVAVSHGLIVPHVQPIVDLHRGVLAGYQGVARWQHPLRGLLDASEFVDLVENTPILPVGRGGGAHRPQRRVRARVRAPVPTAARRPQPHALPHRDHRRAPDFSIGSVRRDRARARLANFAHGRERIARPTRDRSSDGAQRGRRRV